MLILGMLGTALSSGFLYQGNDRLTERKLSLNCLVIMKRQGSVIGVLPFLCFLCFHLFAEKSGYGLGELVFCVAHARTVSTHKHHAAGHIALGDDRCGD